MLFAASTDHPRNIARITTKRCDRKKNFHDLAYSLHRIRISGIERCKALVGVYG